MVKYVVQYVVRIWCELLWKFCCLMCYLCACVRWHLSISVKLDRMAVGGTSEVQFSSQLQLSSEVQFSS